jgi:ketosteroid isomerase-like protein
MLRQVLGLLMTLVAIACASCGSAEPDERAILGVLAAQQEAWNRGDLAGFLEGYEKSDKITFVGRSIARGFDGLEQRYREAYGTREKMGTLTFSELEFRPLNPDAAFVIGRFSLQRSEEGGGAASGLFTVVLQKTASGWKIVHDVTSTN